MFDFQYTSRDISGDVTGFFSLFRGTQNDTIRFQYLPVLTIPIDPNGGQLDTTWT